MIVEILIKVLTEIRNYYDKTLLDEEHWIYNAFEDMIKSDEQLVSSEIKICKSKKTIHVFYFFLLIFFFFEKIINYFC